MPREFRLPDLGEGIAEAQIVRVLIKPGDNVAEDQYLMEVETDKAAVEIPSPYSGVATNVHVKEGQTVNVGQVVVTFDDGAGGTKTAAAAPAKVEAAPPPAQAKPAAATPPPPARPAPAPAPAPVAHRTEAPAAGGNNRTSAPAAPAIRKLAREMGIDIDTVNGSGPGGRITKEDLDRHSAGGGQSSAPARGSAPTSSATAAPQPRPHVPTGPVGGIVDADKWGSVRRVPLSQIRKTIAAQMARSAYTIPHVTHGDEADITELEKVRKQLNEATDNNPKLTVMAFVIRALCIALRRHPIFNSSFDDQGGQIIYKDYINVGIAVDTERGLVVPVIRNADQLSLRGIGDALKAMSDRARANQFSIDDLRGGTFTITNVGALGGTFSTPIINFPEVAILGLSRSKQVPYLRNGQLAEKTMMPVNLSFDHRATDGANSARFTRDIIEFLEMPTKLLLE